MGINNYYTNANCPEQSTQVTVAAPADDFSAGGGYIILTTMQRSKCRNFGVNEE